MTEEESKQLIEKQKEALQLSPLQYQRWAGKKFLCLIEVEQMKEIEAFEYERTNNMDDWIIVKDINLVRK